MARALKPHVMETIRHSRTRDTCDLMLDRNRKIFFADYMGEHFEHAEAAKVTKWINDSLDAGIKIDWQPVLSVSFERDDLKDMRDQGYTPSHKPAAAILSVSRFRVGVLRDGSIRSVRWNLSWANDENEDELRIKNMEHCPTKYQVVDGRVTLPYASKPGGGNSWAHTDRSVTIHLPYSESMWVGLLHMQDAIRNLGQQIEAMVSGEDGQRQIEARGDALIKALPAPAPEPKPETESKEVVVSKVEHVSFKIDPELAAMLWLSGTPIDQIGEFTEE